MTMLPKIAAGLTAIVGGKMLLDNKDFEHAVSHYQDTWQTMDAYHDKTHHFQTGYSPYKWAEKFKHFIIDPTNFMFIWRPMIYVKGTLNYLWENMIPLGLISTGLIYGFGSSYSKVLSRGGALLGPGLRGASTLLKSFGIAGLSGIGKTISLIARNIHLPKRITIPGAIATTAVTGGILYVLKTLNDELNGRTHEKFCGKPFLEPPE